MSVTTTQNPVTGQVLQVLADYDLHHSGAPEHPSTPADVNAREPASQNPEWWPTDHNRIPNYRPVNTNLDRTERPDGVNGIERTFIFTMLNGVWLNANMAWAWRNTGGRFNDQIFRYKIGGEK